MTVCTLTGLSGQDEFTELFDSVRYLIGTVTVKLCPSVALINFGTSGHDRYTSDNRSSDFSSFDINPPLLRCSHVDLACAPVRNSPPEMALTHFDHP